MNERVDHYWNVIEFRETFGLPVSATPRLPDNDALALHHKLICEEVGELYDAIKARDAVEVLDALADIAYLVYGCAVDAGYDLDEALRIVHESNMSKLEDGQVLRRPDGKVLKGRDFMPPALTHLVETQPR